MLDLDTVFRGDRMFRSHSEVKTARKLSNSNDKMKNLLAYAFLWSGVVSAFFGFLATVNALKMSFFLQYSRTIQVNMFSPIVDLYIWFGSIFIFLALSLILRYYGLRIRSLYSGIDICIISIGILLLFAQRISNQSFMVEGAAIGAPLILLGGLMHLTFHIARWSKAFPISRRNAITVTIIYLSSLLIPMEFSALTFRILCAFNPANTFAKEKALLELQLSYSAYPLLPALYLAFLFSWIWIPLLLLFNSRFGRTRFHGGFSKLRSSIRSFSVDQDDRPSGRTVVKWHGTGSSIILLSSLLIGISLAYYPYFHGPSWLVGTDTYWRYLDPLQKILESDNRLMAAFQERHPAYLLILLALKTIASASGFLVVKFMPMVSILLLALATFWLVEVGSKDEFLASLASVFSVLSITTTEGVYTGILANWFTLVLWTLFFVFLLKALRERVFKEGPVNAQLKYFATLAILSLGILLIHPWTWGVFLAVFICYICLTLLRDRSVGWNTSCVMVLIILLNVASAILSVYLLSEIQGWRLEDALSIYEWPLQHVESVLRFYDILGFLVRVYSVFLTPLFFFLAVVGMVFVMSRRGRIEDLIISWTAVASIGSIVAAPLGYNPDLPTHTELIRMLFITPVQMPAAIGLYSIMKAVNHSLSENCYEKSTRNVGASTYWFAVVLSIFNYGIVSQLSLTGVSASAVFSLLILNFAVTTVLLQYFGGRLQAYATLLLSLLVVLALVNSSFGGLFSLLTDPNYYRPS